MKIKQILPMSLSIIGILVLVSSLLTQRVNKLLDETNFWVEHTYQVKAELKQLEKLLVDAETGQRGYIYSGDSTFLRPYNNTINVLDDQINLLTEKIANTPSQISNLQNLKLLSDQKMEDLNATIELKQSGQEEALRQWVTSGRGMQIMDQVRDKIEIMFAEQNNLLAQRQASVERIKLIHFWVNWGSFIIIIALSFGTYTIVHNIVLVPVQSIVKEINQSTQEIMFTVDNHEAQISAQAGAVNQTTTTMDELGRSFQNAFTQVSNSSQSATQALATSQNGNQTVQETLVGMQNLSSRMNGISEQINLLASQAGQIGTIAGLVGTLANQTNMLALNSAVEAVRAGEHGKGFTVVSAEIRKLAEQSKQSADKINTLVGDINKAIHQTVFSSENGKMAVSESVVIVGKTASAFEGINDAIANVVDNSQQVTVNIQQQNVAVQQVVEAMNSIKETSYSIVAGITQTKSEVDRLKEIAVQLQQMI
ncbi:CHASE3 domain-containing protein [Spirulina subsalsa FACHB-351]|uniref:CHASE3 domain-containing protein n=1 Tax=Spirulina subsalsa FACHB-351 TaxID=234711 RepID=A0ABT3LA11_9CYAN|nr:CHASE3 domain-containing protein [Spirulina subsalsa]MCW6037810.1 CHASE3 domain-containing protein [Spirulina subsalsa FACHB-351]